MDVDSIGLVLYLFNFRLIFIMAALLSSRLIEGESALLAESYRVYVGKVFQHKIEYATFRWHRLTVGKWHMACDCQWYLLPFSKFMQVWCCKENYFFPEDMA